MSSLNARLVDLRNQRGKSKLTQEDVGKMLDLPRTSIHEYEKEDGYVPHTVIEKYCKTFDVSADYLFGFSNMQNYNDKIRINDLGLTDEAIDKLLKKEIDPLILSKLIEEDEFDDLLILANIYRSNYTESLPFVYNSLITSAESNPNFNSRELELLKNIVIDEDVLYSQKISDLFLKTLKKIKTKNPTVKVTPVANNSMINENTLDELYKLLDDNNGDSVTKLISSLSVILGLTGEYSEALGTHIIGLIKCLNTSPVIEANQKKRRRNYLKQKEE